MKTPEEIAVENGLFSDINSIYGNFDLQITRDCHVHTSKMIIKAIKQAQIESYNQAIDDASENAKTDCKYKSDEWGMNRSMYHSIDKQSILKLKK